MPITRISMRSGYSADDKELLSAIIQNALQRYFAVPVGDRFQLFDEYQKENRIISPNYLSRGRSEDYLLLEITAGKPRTANQKQALYQALAREVESKLGISPADLMVNIKFTNASDWSFSEGQIYKEEA
jgi:hypothetical protein